MTNKKKPSESPTPPLASSPEKPETVPPPALRNKPLPHRPVIYSSSSDEEEKKPPPKPPNRRRVTFSATTTVHVHKTTQPSRPSLPVQKPRPIPAGHPRLMPQPRPVVNTKGSMPFKEKQTNANMIRKQQQQMQARPEVTRPQLSDLSHDPTASNIIRRKYSELIEDCQTYEKDPNTEDLENQMKVNILKGKQLFSEIGGGPGDMHMAFLHTRHVTSVIRTAAESIGSADSGFKIEHYLQCIQNNISTSMSQIDPQKYRYLAAEANLAFRTTPCFTALVGSFDRDKIFVPKEKKQRVPIRRKKFENEMGQTHEEGNKFNGGDKATADVVSKAIHQVVIKKYEKTHKPLNLVQLTLDRRSFPRTVDNLFNTSFLVKEGKLTLDKSDSEEEESVRERRSLGIPKSNFKDGSLHIYPTTLEPPKQSSMAPKHQVLNRNQHIVSFNSAMWKHICEKAQGECFINVSINKYRNKMRRKEHHMRMSRLSANVDPNKPPPSDEQMRAEALRSQRKAPVQPNYRLPPMPPLPQDFLLGQGILNPTKIPANPSQSTPGTRPTTRDPRRLSTATSGNKDQKQTQAQRREVRSAKESPDISKLLSKVSLSTKDPTKAPPKDSVKVSAKDFPKVSPAKDSRKVISRNSAKNFVKNPAATSRDSAKATLKDSVKIPSHDSLNIPSREASKIPSKDSGTSSKESFDKGTQATKIYGQSKSDGKSSGGERRMKIIVPGNAPGVPRPGLPRTSVPIQNKPTEPVEKNPVEKRSESPTSNVGLIQKITREPPVLLPMAIPKLTTAIKDTSEKRKEPETPAERVGRTSPRKGIVKEKSNEEIPMETSGSEKSDKSRTTRQTRSRSSK